MSDTEVQPAPDTGAGNDDVRADAIAAFEKHMAPAVAEGEEPAAADEGASTDRPRNERGQFIRADGTVDTTEPAPEPVSEPDPSTGKLEQPSPAEEPPKGWRADVKAKWSTLDPSVRAEVSRRESEMDAAGARWSEEKRNVEMLLDPIRQQAARTGLSFDEGFKRLVDMSAWMERDPQGAIRALAQNYGIDLTKPNDAPVTATQQPQVQADPRVAQLQTELTGLKGMIEQRERAEAQSAIEAFAKAPGHEHFDSVKETMGKLIASGQASDIPDAYEQAIWLVPSVRTQVLAAQTAAAEADRKAKEKEAAEKARRGAVSINGSPAGAGAPVAKPEYGSVFEAAKAAWEQHAN